MRGRPKGFKHTEESKLKNRLSHFGKPGVKSMLGKKHTKETIEKMRLASTGRLKSEETKEKIRKAHLGRKYSSELIEHNRQALLRPEVRLQKSLSRRGNKSHFWKGGVSAKNQIIRESLEYRLWREAVFKRDNYTCIWCGTTNCELNADHIKPFAYYPELRFAIDNGRTLCVPCHKTTETFGTKMNIEKRTN